MRKIFPFRIIRSMSVADNVWRDVRSPSGEGGCGIDAGVPAGRSDRHGELESGGIRRGKFSRDGKDGATSSHTAAHCYGEMSRLCVNAWAPGTKNQAV